MDSIDGFILFGREFGLVMGFYVDFIFQRNQLNVYMSREIFFALVIA